MKLISRITYSLIFLSVLSCANSDDERFFTLSSYLGTMTYTNGAVISCAASDQNTNNLLTFYYPEAGATNIRLYQTTTVDINPDDFSNYQQVFIENEPFFNGYLGKFVQSTVNEKWTIVTFELDGDIKVSNPIRSKQMTKPTVWTDVVSIDQLQSGMPKFVWEHNAVGDNAIYFQVLSNNTNDLISGTYTYDNFFQFYNTDNVVLNITTETPSPLILNEEYNFTLMDVSEDNWVNWVVLKTFLAE